MIFLHLCKALQGEKCDPELKIRYQFSFKQKQIFGHRKFLPELHQCTYNLHSFSNFGRIGGTPKNLVNFSYYEIEES